MPTFLWIARHSPENCDAYNEEARKVTLAAMTKFEGLLKKHGVKSVGGWIVPTEHLVVMVFEAPSLDAFQKFGMEPEIAALGAYNTAELKIAMSIEEAMKMMLQAK